MNTEELAQISNYLMGSSFAVLCIAFVCHVGEWVSARKLAKVPAGAAGELIDDSQEPTAADKFAAVALSLTVLAAGLLIGASVVRGIAAQRAPFGNMYEFGMTGTAIALTVYLILVWRSQVQWLGGLVAGLSIFVLGLSLSTYVPAAPLVPALNTFWKYIHVTAIMLAAAMFIVGAAASALYLVKARAEDRGTVGPVLSRFPAAAKIDRLAFTTNAIGFPLWTFGTLISGPIWAHLAWGRYWGWDPKEVWALITWIVYAGYLHARVTAGWKGRRAAIVALVGFGTFIFSYYIVNLMASEWGIFSYHTYAK